jgi:hypothetical protein
MKPVKVPVLIDYHTVPRRYRSLLRKLQQSQWSRPELRWVRRHHPDLPPIVLAVIRQKLAARSSGMVRWSRHQRRWTSSAY